MAAIGPNTFSFGLVALQLLIETLGSRRTGMTGKQKMDHAADKAALIFDATAKAAAGNTKSDVSRLEILAAGQAIHDTLSAIGAIQPTSVLEASVLTPIQPSAPDLNIAKSAIPNKPEVKP